MQAAAALQTYRPKLAYASQKNKAGSLRSNNSSTRPLYLKGHVISQASGSASCELGRTKVICSVYGPRPRRQGGRGEFSDRGAIDVEASFATFSKETCNKEARERDARELARFVESCLEASVQLERFPKSVLDVYLIVLEDDGSAATCAALCASYAIAKAGIDMTDIVVTCALGVTSTGDIIVDPDAEEEKAAVGLCRFAMMSSKNAITCFDIVAKDSLPLEVAGKFAAAGKVACESMAQTLRAQLVQEFKQERMD